MSSTEGAQAPFFMYSGWIPNVSGYLSLSHLGGIPIRHRVLEELIHPPTKFQDGGDVVSIIQRRNLSDKPEIGSLKPNTKGGIHTFLLQAKLSLSPTGSRLLTGIVMSVPQVFHSHLYEVHKDFVKGKLLPNGPIPTTYASVISSLGQVTGAGHFCLEFELSDDGVITLKSLSNASPTDNQGALLAFEAYSFVKDLLHKHRFHSHSDDAMLELTEVSNVHDAKWATKVIRNLHRSIISSFRSSSSPSQNDALGKLSYLDSFINIADRRKLSVGLDISTKTLREALTHYQACGHEMREDRSVFTTFAISVVAVALPLLFICLQLLQIPCIAGLTQSDTCKHIFIVAPAVINLAHFVLQHLEYVIVGCILLFMLVLVYLWRQRLYRYSEARTAEGSFIGEAREILLRMSVTNPKVTKFCLILSAVLVAAISYETITWLLDNPQSIWKQGKDWIETRIRK